MDWEHQNTFLSLCLLSSLNVSQWKKLSALCKTLSALLLQVIIEYMLLLFPPALSSPQFLPDWWRWRGFQQDMGVDSQSVREWRHTHPKQPTRWIWQQTQTWHWRWALIFSQSIPLRHRIMKKYTHVKGWICNQTLYTTISFCISSTWQWFSKLSQRNIHYIIKSPVLESLTFWVMNLLTLNLTLTPVTYYFTVTLAWWLGIAWYPPKLQRLKMIW